MTPDAAHHFLVLTYVVLGVAFAAFALRTFVTARGSKDKGSIEAALRGELVEIKTRLAAVETILREVG